MATDALMGLFGSSAYDVEQARNKQALDYAVQMANMNNIQQAKMGIGQGAAGIARAGAGMFGLVDPKVEEAKRTQAIMAQGGDLTTSKGLKEKAAQFAQAGDQTTALKLMLLARKQEQEEAKMLIEQRKQILAERKQEDAETDARELKKMQIMATIRQADERIADKRTSEADRVAAMRERTEAMLLLGKMANALKAGQQQTKAPTGLTREARLRWELDNGLIDQPTYDAAMLGTAGGKAMEKKRTQEEALGKVGQKVENVIGTVDEAIEKTGFLSTGLTGKAMSMIPGTGAFDLEATLDTVKANLGFNELQDMRNASPTGGALGQVAVRELEMLQSTIASLKMGQSYDKQMQSLRKIKTHLENWKNAVSGSSKIEQIPTGSPSPKTGGKPSVSNW